MKQWNRRLALVVLALVLALSSIAPAMADTEKSDLYIEGSDGVTLTVWCTISSGAAKAYTTLAEHPFFIWLKEKTGVNVEFYHPSYEQMDQQLNLMIASGDFYDILNGAWYPGGPQAGVDEGCFVDLNQYLDYLPDYLRYATDTTLETEDWLWTDALKEIYQPTAQEPFLDHGCLTSKGELWCVTQVWRTEYLPDAGALIRKDWLDELNLEVPTTIAELEEVLAAFKTLGDDVIPMELPAKGYDEVTGNIAGAFGFRPAYYFARTLDGQVDVSNLVKPEFKDYLHKVNEWYEAGYIDPDFMNREDAAAEALLLSDRLGIWLASWTESDYYNNLYDGEDENFELVAMPNLVMEEGQQLHYKQYYNSSPSNYLSLTTSCKNPEIACQWMNTFFKQESLERQLFGEEGVTYTKGEDGAYVYTDEFYADMENLRDTYLFGGLAGVDSVLTMYLRSDPSAYTQPAARVVDQLVWAGDCGTEFGMPYVVFADDDWGTMDSLMAEVHTYADPMVLRFINGSADIDAEWDNYVATVNALGLEEAQGLWQMSLDNMG